MRWASTEFVRDTKRILCNWNLICKSADCYHALLGSRSLSRHRDSTGLFQGSRTPLHFIPISVPPAQAKEAFIAHQGSNVLSPGSIIGHHSGHTIKLAYFPFWTFKATFDLQYCARVAHKSGGDGSSGERCNTHSKTNVTLKPADAAAQVYAAFTDRRDLADGLKPVIGEHVGALRQLATLAELQSQLDAHQHADVHLELQPVEVRQAIAWELALRAFRHWQESLAVEQLKQEYGTEDVRDVEMTVQVRSRAAQVVYVPGYVITYSYGNIQVGSIDIVKQRHAALVPAAGAAGRIVSERHISPRKAQAATAAAVLSGSTAYQMASVPVAEWSWLTFLSVDVAFWAFLASSAAGLLARSYTGLMRDRHAGVIDDRIHRNQERYMSGGMTATSMEDALDAWLRNDAEWLRWEEADKWDWDHHKRRLGAERLFREHKLRRLRNVQAARRVQAEEARREEEATRAAFREARFGRSQRDHMFAGGVKAGGKLDFKGYYKLLGLDLHKSSPSQGDIKKAYREGAKRHHPDRVHHLPSGEQAAAMRKFRDLQDAYEVLADPQKRKLYDSGQVPS